MDREIVISTPPHIKTSRTTKRIMLDVIIALLPAAIMGIVYFGLDAFIVEIVAVASAVASEFVYYFIANGGFAKKCKNARTVCVNWIKQFDLTSVITGLILALELPPDVKWHEVLIGSAFAIVIVKMLFGGTGRNLVAPSTAGRVFMFISFSITTYIACNIAPISSSSDLFTGATYLSGSLLADEPTLKMSLIDLFLGTGLAGCIGETCKLAIIVGYIYLVVRKVIKWWQPVLFIAAAFLFSLFTNGFDCYNALELILSGGLIFGGVFMVTDYVTSPKGFCGQILYLVILGALTAVLRHYTKIEVVSFVIMLGNLIVPLIDRYIPRRPFGYRRESRRQEAE